MAIDNEKRKRLIEELTVYMKKNKLSKSKLSGLLKMTPGSLGNYLAGLANVGRKIEERLKVLGIDVEYINTGYRQTKKYESGYTDNSTESMRVSESMNKYSLTSGMAKDVLIRSLTNENSVLRHEIDSLRIMIVEYFENEQE